MIERVPADHQIRALVEERELLGSDRQIDRAAAGFVVNQHAESLIDPQERIDRDLHGRRERREVTCAASPRLTTVLP